MLVIFLYFISPLLTNITYSAWQSTIAQSQISKFQPYIKDYLNISNLSQSNQPAYIYGRYIIVDKSQGEIDTTIDDFGGTAASPEEVGTIILRECEQYTAGRFEYGGTSYGERCKVTIIDKAKSTIVDEKTFEDYESITRRGQDTYGSTSRKIREYINSLPVQ
jgi:hypothetical protein